jgi:hypothetical protein
VNRLYNVISSYEVIGFFLVFRRINEGNSIKNIYGTSLVRGNKRLYLTPFKRTFFGLLKEKERKKVERC